RRVVQSEAFPEHATKLFVDSDSVQGMMKIAMRFWQLLAKHGDAESRKSEDVARITVASVVLLRGCKRNRSKMRKRHARINKIPELGDTKVTYSNNTIIAHQDIRWLDVAVHDRLGVGIG